MLRVKTPPAALPVSVADAKLHLGLSVSDTSQDARIETLIKTATDQAQNTVQRRFVTQTLQWPLVGWSPVLRLPVAPVVPSGIASIKYVVEGASQTLPTGQYVCQPSGETVCIRPARGYSWPLVDCDAPEPIVIEFTAGNAVADIPAGITSAIMFGVQHFYHLGARDAALTQRSVTGVGSRTYDASKAAVLPQQMLDLLLSEAWT